jgi:hypothetical protein
LPIDRLHRDRTVGRQQCKLHVRDAFGSCAADCRVELVSLFCGLLAIAEADVDAA